MMVSRGRTPLWAAICPLDISLTVASSAAPFRSNPMHSVDTNRSTPTELSLSHFAKRISLWEIKF